MQEVATGSGEMLNPEFGYMLLSCRKDPLDASATMIEYVRTRGKPESSWVDDDVQLGCAPLDVVENSIGHVHIIDPKDEVLTFARSEYWNQLPSRKMPYRKNA